MDRESGAAILIPTMTFNTHDVFVKSGRLVNYRADADDVLMSFERYNVILLLNAYYVCFPDAIDEQPSPLRVLSSNTRVCRTGNPDRNNYTTPRTRGDKSLNVQRHYYYFRHESAGVDDCREAA